MKYVENCKFFLVKIKLKAQQITKSSRFSIYEEFFYNFLVEVEDVFIKYLILTFRAILSLPASQTNDATVM
jgi:hypothetical protein